MPGRVYAQFIEYFNNFDQFLHLLFRLARLRSSILRAAPHTEFGPEVLPSHVAAYLEDCVRLHPLVIARLWTELRPFIHELNDTDYRAAIDDSFRQEGRAHGLGMTHFSSSCQHPNRLPQVARTSIHRYNDVFVLSAQHPVVVF